MGAIAEQNQLWVTDLELPLGHRISASQASRVLGREHLFVVYDMYGGFNPDGFAAVAGTVLAGGLLIVLAPKPPWRNFEDPERSKLATAPWQADDVGGRFLQRFENLLRHYHGAEWLGGNDVTYLQQIIQSSVSVFQARPRMWSLTVGQLHAVEEIQRLATSAEKGVLVITSDRGRGKSTAMGVAAAQLMKARPFTIILVAPRVQSVEALYEHCKGVLDVSLEKKYCLVYAESTLKFYPVDHLLGEYPQADLILVDEAAAIPTHLLEQIVDHYKRVVFSTTIHGYEGNGRGFAVRFQSKLLRQYPEYKTLRLTQPVRWDQDDAMEKFLFDSLLMDAQAVQLEQSGVKELAHELSQYEVKKLDRDVLLEDETLLRQLMGLLVIAHYRTTPGDLRIILDSPNIELYATFLGGDLVAAVLLAVEGEMAADLQDPIWLGRRRLRGHVLPQTLSQQLGFKRATDYKYGRVVRVAVLPELQQLGVGSLLIKWTEQDLAQRGFDIMGASFALLDDSLRFWKKNLFSVVRIGVSKEKTSGARAGTVLRGISRKGGELQAKCLGRFEDQWPLCRREYLHNLPAKILGLIDLDDEPLDDRNGLIFEEQDRQDMEAYIYGARPYETCLLAITRFVKSKQGETAASTTLSIQEQAIVSLKIMQGLSWDEVVSRLALKGKKQAQFMLRNALKKWQESSVQNI